MRKRILLSALTLLVFLCTVMASVAQTTYTVTNVNDAGAGSLRQAIVDANSNVDLSNINFNITGTGPFSIVLSSVLPDIITRVSINGFSQSGSSVTNYKIKVVPSVSLQYFGFKFITGSANSTIEGIEISNFSTAISINSASSIIVKNNLINSTGGTGIAFTSSSSSTVTGNKIGLDVTGLAPVGTINIGIFLSSCSSFVIGGSTLADRNHIANTSAECIKLYLTTGTIIKGNLLGLDKNENVFPLDANKSYSGIALESSSYNTIGGNNTTEGNIIGGTKQNFGLGIQLLGLSSTNNVIKGNRIGINSSDIIVPNGVGVYFIDNCNNNIIGSNISAEANIISGNSNYGIWIISGSNSNTIKGNKIGTNAAGTLAKPNYTGIMINGDPSVIGAPATPIGLNIIGGNTAAEGNIISGNIGEGIMITSSNQNIIKNNLIGVNSNGTAAIPNHDGIKITREGNNTIGTNNSNGNTISGNIGNGIELQQTQGNIIKGNYIGTNSSLSNIYNQGYGILLSASSLNQIGGITNEANIIANNTSGGIDIFGSINTNGNKNSILSNLIYDNGTGASKAIDLNSNGNNNKPAPTITSTVVSGGNLTVSGTTSANGDKIQLYFGTTAFQNANIQSNSYDVISSGTNWTITIPYSAVSAIITSYPKLMATATDIDGNTSEFGNCMAMVNIATLPSQYCLNATPITLSGTPAGGVFSGTGVSGNTFTPSTVGSIVITYTATISGCSAGQDQRTIKVEDYSNITVNQSCSYEPGLKRRWYVDHPTHTNPIDLTYTITNPVDATTINGTVTTNSSGRTYFETPVGGTALVGLYDFAASGDATLPGYTLDIGQVYNPPTKTFGWDVDNQSNVLTSALTMWDNRYAKGINTRNMGTIRNWKLDVPSGDYEVKLVCGYQTTGATPAKIHNVTIEGTVITDPNTSTDWDEYIVRVSVTDGTLNIVPGSTSSSMAFSFVEVRRIVTNTISLKACNVAVATTTNTGLRCDFNGAILVCPASSNNYDVSTPAIPVVGSTFSWAVSPTGTAVISGSTNASTLASNTQTGPVTITVTETNTNYAGGSSSVSKNVYIQPVAQANFSPFIGCVVGPNWQATFTNTSPTVSSYTNSYKWYVDNTQVSTSTNLVQGFNGNPAIPTALQGLHAIKLENTVRGCSTQYILPNYVAAPTPPASFTVSDAAVCTNTIVNFTNTTSSSNLLTMPSSSPSKTLDGAWQFEWNLNDGSPIENTNVPAPHTYINTTSTNIIRTAVLVVKNNNFGCQSYTTSSINVYGQAKATIVGNPQGVSCPGLYNGQVTFALAGGTAPYFYAIKYTVNGITTTVTTGSAASAGNVTIPSGANFLGMGDYFIEVADKGTAAILPSETERCITSTPFSIPFDGATIGICKQLRACNGTTGSIQINSSIATTSNFAGGNYSYILTDKFNPSQSWSGTGITFNSGSMPNAITVSNIPDGSYTLKITTSTGCTQNFDIDMGPPILNPGLAYGPICNVAGLTAPVGFTPSTSRNSCFSMTGSYTLQVRRASDNALMTTVTPVPPATFSYTLAPGVYTYSLTEANSACTVTGSFDIAKGAPFTVAVQNIRNVKCLGTNDGSATALVVGGTSNISYSWIDNANPSTPLLIQGAIAKDLPAGSYKVIATDNNSGCEVTSSDFSIVNANPIIIQSVVRDGALGSCRSTATMTTGSTGLLPIKYSWIRQLSAGQTDTRYVSPAVMDLSHTASDIIPGTYEVIVTDANGCKSNPYPFVQLGLKRTYEICMRYINEPRLKTPPTDPPIANEIEVETVDLARALQEKTQKCLDKLENDAHAEIKEKCEDPANLQDKLKLQYTLTQYQYTLYKYNRAGDLTATIPPNAVANMIVNGTIPTDRTGVTSSTLTEYKDYQTSYRYNTLGQLVFQNTPDAGNSIFYYNNKGQLRFSRNAKQLASTGNGTYSYTKYDVLGRATEVGENNNWTAANASLNTNVNDFTSYPTTGTDRTLTYYSLPAASLVNYTFTSGGTGGTPQRYQRNRVSRIDRENLYTSGSTTLITTRYSYDPHGNVEWLRHDNPYYNSFTAYEYDLISNKVTKVKYNEGYLDRLFHKYQYDTDNRITEVYTSKNNIVWEKDATYDYFLHGPMSRQVLGQDKVQGMDYTYTIQGWLKGINSPDLTSAKDPGGDNGSTTAPDVFGMGLTYFKGDFDNNTANAFNSSTSATNSLKLDPSEERFNGNITAWSMQVLNPTGGGTNLMGNRYLYDRLNRILSSNYVSYNGVNWNAQNTSDYNTTYTYDPNGNIKSLMRKGFLSSSSNAMDNLAYTYDEPLHTFTASNRLKRVIESGDHPNQSTLGWGDINATRNNRDYTYDEIGNLVLDLREQVKITWDIYGKVKQVDPTDASGNVITATTTTPGLTFLYDPMGNRAGKIKATNVVSASTQDYYYRDASGNMMEVIRLTPTGSTPATSVTELSIYGSDRLGEYKPVTSDMSFSFAYAPGRIAPSADETILIRKIGTKQYEMKDHLGNITATVSDRILKVGVTNPLRAEMYSYSAYYPFGMVMPGKSFTSLGYRYGFNGMEKDDEISGNGNSYTAEYWQYDSRLGRRWNKDPKGRIWESSYACFGDNPIINVDPRGDYFFGLFGSTSSERRMDRALEFSKNNDGDLRMEDGKPVVYTASYKELGFGIPETTITPHRKFGDLSSWHNFTNTISQFEEFIRGNSDGANQGASAPEAISAGVGVTVGPANISIGLSFVPDEGFDLKGTYTRGATAPDLGINIFLDQYQFSDPFKKNKTDALNGDQSNLGVSLDLVSVSQGTSTDTQGIVYKAASVSLGISLLPANGANTKSTTIGLRNLASQVNDYIGQKMGVKVGQ